MLLSSLNQDMLILILSTYTYVYTEYCDICRYVLIYAVGYPACNNSFPEQITKHKKTLKVKAVNNNKS